MLGGFLVLLNIEAELVFRVSGTIKDQPTTQLEWDEVSIGRMLPCWAPHLSTLFPCFPFPFSSCSPIGSFQLIPFCVYRSRTPYSPKTAASNPMLGRLHAYSKSRVRGIASVVSQRHGMVWQVKIRAMLSRWRNSMFKSQLRKRTEREREDSRAEHVPGHSPGSWGDGSID